MKNGSDESKHPPPPHRRSHHHDDIADTSASESDDRVAPLRSLGVSVSSSSSSSSSSKSRVKSSSSVPDQINAMMKRAADHVEENAAAMVKVLRGETADYGETANSHHEAGESGKQDVQMETLDYDNIFDYVHENSLLLVDDEQQQRKHQLILTTLKVLMTVLIAFVTAMLMWFVNVIVTWAAQQRVNTTINWIVNGYSAVAYFTFLFASISITAVASLLCTVIAPHARGGGVPYLFAYLNGTNVSQFFTFRIVAVKVCALAFTIAGGLTLGMEGPFVYIGGGVALLLNHCWDYLPWFSASSRYTRILRSIHEERIFMACGLAAGLAVAFSAPIAGILFALEGATSFLTITAVLRIFGCSMFAMFFKDLSFNGWSSHITTTNLITIIVGENTTYAWLVGEVLAFTIMAVIGGLLGAIAVHLNVVITKWRHYYMEDRIRANMLEVALITAVTASIMFVLPLMFGCKVMPTFCADHGETRCQSLFCGFGEYSEIGSIVYSSSDIIARNLFDRTISINNEYDPFPLLVYMICYVFLVAWVYGAYVPGGLFVPSIIIGACYGRVVGFIGHAYVSTSVNPGVYSLLGAAAMLGGFTRLGLPVVVMLVEMTGDATYLLPIMYVATLAKLLADYLEPPLYPQHMKIEGIAQLGDRLPLVIAEKTAADIMNTHFFAIHDCDTLEHILDVLDLTKAMTIPVTDEHDRFIGMISRTAIAYALKYTPLFPDKQSAQKLHKQQLQQEHISRRGSTSSDHSNSSRTSDELNNNTGSASDAIEAASSVSQLGSRARAAQEELLVAGNTMEEFAGGDWHQLTVNDVTATMDYQFHEAHLQYYLNVASLVDIGVLTIQQEASNKRVHAMMRRIGLSHLCVINQQHQLKGIITRRNLITPNIPPTTQHAEAQIDNSAGDHLPAASAGPASASASVPASVPSSVIVSVSDADGRSLVLDDDELISAEELDNRRKLMRRKSTVQRIAMHTQQISCLRLFVPSRRRLHSEKDRQ